MMQRDAAMAGRQLERLEICVDVAVKIEPSPLDELQRRRRGDGLRNGRQAELRVVRVDRTPWIELGHAKAPFDGNLAAGHEDEDESRYVARSHRGGEKVVRERRDRG